MKNKKVKIEKLENFKKLQLATKVLIKIKGGRGPSVDPYG